MPLNLVDGNERVDLLHPIFVARLEALAADPRMKGQLKSDSAVRTAEEQQFLFDNQNEPGFNLAADPVRTFATTAYGLSTGRGSWHMVQDDGFGYAVDVATALMTDDVLAVLAEVAAEYRLQQTVLHPGRSNPPSPQPPQPCTPAAAADVKENWHLQIPFDEIAPLTWTPQEDVMNPAQEKKLDELLKEQAALMKSVDTLLTRTDLLLDAVEGRELAAPGATPRNDPPLRRVVEAIAVKVGAKTK